MSTPAPTPPQRTEAEARQLEAAHGALEAAIGQGRPSSRARSAGWCGRPAHRRRGRTLTKRLVEGSGSDLYAEHLQGRVLTALDEAVAYGLTTEEARPSSTPSTTR